MLDLSRVRQDGMLAPWAEGFAEALLGLGYTPDGAAKQLHLFAHLSRWLEEKGLEPGGLDGDAITLFFAHRRAVGYSRQVSVRAAEPMIGYLRGVGVVPPARQTRGQGRVDVLLADYERYLVMERALVHASARDYAVTVRPFLGEYCSPEGLGLDQLDGAAVVAFVVKTCRGKSRSTAKRTIKALRSLI